LWRGRAALEQGNLDEAVYDLRVLDQWLRALKGVASALM
jgi:hypothetical protein